VRLAFTPHGREDYTYWPAADRATLKRINRLIGDALRDPATGIGKPEPLHHLLAGAWSWRSERPASTTRTPAAAMCRARPAP
jgi:toxin YoeB